MGDEDGASCKLKEQVPTGSGSGSDSPILTTCYGAIQDREVSLTAAAVVSTTAQNSLTDQDDELKGSAKGGTTASVKISALSSDQCSPDAASAEVEGAGGSSGPPSGSKFIDRFAFPSFSFANQRMSASHGRAHGRSRSIGTTLRCADSMEGINSGWKCFPEVSLDSIRSCQNLPQNIYTV